MDFSNLTLNLLAYPAVAIGVFGLVMLLRPVFCWYFKINERMAILSRIEQHLSTLVDQQQQRSANEQPDETAEVEARDPYLKNLSGEELEEGLKGLVLRADERIY